MPDPVATPSLHFEQAKSLADALSPDNERPVQAFWSPVRDDAGVPGDAWFIRYHDASHRTGREITVQDGLARQTSAFGDVKNTVAGIPVFCHLRPTLDSGEALEALEQSALWQGRERLDQVHHLSLSCIGGVQAWTVDVSGSQHGDRARQSFSLDDNGAVIAIVGGASLIDGWAVETSERDVASGEVSTFETKGAVRVAISAGAYPVPVLALPVEVQITTPTGRVLQETWDPTPASQAQKFSFIVPEVSVDEAVGAWTVQVDAPAGVGSFWVSTCTGLPTESAAAANEACRLLSPTTT